MEKGALIGMMALAASDLLFCMVTISGTNLPTKFIFYQRDYAFYYTLYGNFLQNTLIKTSTWLTVILAVGRYAVVTSPIKARQYMRCRHTVIAIVTSCLFWIFLHIPLTYMWRIVLIQCPTPIIYILIAGDFVENDTLNSTFTYIWGILGFIIPILILAYCNMTMIVSLNVSRKLRRNRLEGQRSSDLNNFNQKLITVTLVSVVCMFFVLVMPSEIIHFYGEIAQPDYSGTYQVLLLTSNLLQAINFSMNFALYCFVNQHFRKTIRNWLSKAPIFKRIIKRAGSTYSRSSINTSTVTFRSSVCSKHAAL